MSRRLVVTAEAFDDIRTAYRWYEQRREGLGASFELALEATFNRIQRMPEAHREIAPTFRRAVMRRFPYDVYFRHDSHQVLVVLVMHTAQDPQRASTRLRSQ